MSETFFVDVAAAVPGEGDRTMAVEVFRPDGTPTSVLCCLAGGGVTAQFHAAGIDTLLTQFQPFEPEMRRFAAQVMPRLAALRVG